jgi:hypothetical protein
MSSVSSFSSVGSRERRFEPTATDALTRALITIASQGLRTHCSDPATHHLWLSEHEPERTGSTV